MKRTRTYSATLSLCLAAVIAALYVVLTYLCYLFGLASLPIQIRVSEALCVLVLFTPAAIPGVTLGCFISNLIMASPLPDVIFGTLASFIGVLAGYLLRRYKWAIPIPTIAANTIIIPLVLKYAYGLDGTVPFFMLTVGLGEILSAGVIGALLMRVIPRSRIFDSLDKKRQISDGK